MSYLVLARKWRPKNLDEVVGQDHVVRTLAHALDKNRLHHTYLFSGTRGVGKTTLARILAKALNCEQGVTSKPCGECSACLGINEGKFIDLIEVDAASRTKVEDTRALLDNVPYQTTSGRFKIYLIDEVHMLSGHSFNALLKTLEEPPPHVKFLLATTDPQKLPVTVLSRCIQFNLRALDTQEISGQLSMILDEESIQYDHQALTQISQQARGSMRDGLSLLDQAISFGAGAVTEETVRSMLGMISRDYHAKLLESLVNHDAGQVLAVISDINEHGANYETILDELLIIFHKLALHRVSDSLSEFSNFEMSALLEQGEHLSDDDLQLFYQIGLIGKRDLPLAPDPRSGFEMVMLRMIAFVPESQSKDRSGSPVPLKARKNKTAAKTSEAPRDSLKKSEKTTEQKSEPVSVNATKNSLESAEDWQQFVVNTQFESLSASSVVRKLAFVSRDKAQVKLTLNGDESPDLQRDKDQRNVREIELALKNHFGESIEVSIIEERSDSQSIEERERQEQLQQNRESKRMVQEARERILSEPGANFLVNQLGALIDENSIQISTSQDSQNT